MKVLLVTPTQSSETVTAVHVARNLVDRGHGAAFVASPGACRQLPPRFLECVFELTGNVKTNLGIWNRALERVVPDVVLFADYPLLAWQSSTPLRGHPEWDRSLQKLQVPLVTFDHLGLAQVRQELTLGPRHLCPQTVGFAPLPEGMRTMLPCPMHHPGPLGDRRGDPFRYRHLPLELPEDLRRQVRRTYLDDEKDLLVLHSVPAWAWRMAEALGLPYYEFLPEILAWYFERVSRPVTLVSVNNGSLLPQPSEGRFRIVNRPAMPITAFERLLLSADLVVTENKPSFTIGMAVCGLRPCAVLGNTWGFPELTGRLPGRLRECVEAMERRRPGAVFAFDAFPLVATGELEKLWLYRSNLLADAFEQVEIFGGEPTRQALAGLLEDREARDALRERQQAYVEMLQQADDASDLLERYLGDRGVAGPRTT